MPSARLNNVMNKSGSRNESLESVERELRTRLAKVNGIDYKRGAAAYVEKLDSSARYHLYTKPFYNLAHKVSRWTGDGLDEDTHRHFCDFANIAYTLALSPSSSILDVGCGSGWLCEYFARFGYSMTGIDLSSDMIAIGKERIRKVPYGVDEQTSLSCCLLVHDIESEPLPETFDAVICYDSLHHFENEHAVLRNISSMMNYGGQLFIVEGEKPTEGSPTENELRNTMQQYETLESPFSRDYLLKLLREIGFAVVGDYTSVTGFVDRENFIDGSIHMTETLAFHYLLCKKVSRDDRPVGIRDSQNPGRLQAKFVLESHWFEQMSANSEIDISLIVHNIGDTLWLVSRAPLTGRIRLGSKVFNREGEIVEEIHGVPPIQRAVAPGEQIKLRLQRKAPHTPGRYTLKLDLLDQNICWFEQHDSQPLLLDFEVT
jgi:2-polyprenyl-3-methyl-5-hydroxy-6-metoxy-1,4-benzoquinol methylase